MVLELTDINGDAADVFINNIAHSFDEEGETPEQPVTVLAMNNADEIRITGASRDAYLQVKTALARKFEIEMLQTLQFVEQTAPQMEQARAQLAAQLAAQNPQQS